MKITESKLRRIIRNVIKESMYEIPEEGESYVEDHAEMQMITQAEMYAEDEDWEGYLEFGKQHGYSEDQLGEWFDAAEDALFQSAVDSYEPELVKRGSLDPDELEEDLRTGKIDLVRKPYALD